MSEELRYPHVFASQPFTHQVAEPAQQILFAPLHPIANQTNMKFVAILPLAAAVVLQGPEKYEDAFHQFLDKHHRGYKKGSTEYVQRLELFTQRFEEAQHLNSQPGRTWKAGITPLADLTSQELSKLKGWAGAASPTRGHGKQLRSGMSLLQNDLPEEFMNWTTLETLKDVNDQGSCGSCWAAERQAWVSMVSGGHLRVTAATVLDTHREIYHKEEASSDLSAQQLVDCVPNPRNCGGSGGCSGATVELAMAYTLKNGLATEATVPYAGTDGTCTSSSLLQFAGQEDVLASGVRMASADSIGFQTLRMRGWERLPENKYEPLMRALVFRGPVAVSVSATGWEMYLEGVFGDCSKDAVIDHAVTLIGYGKDAARDMKYWTIQNSWGSSFGEEGKIRLHRQDDEDQYCGVDRQPQLGTACEGGPAEVRVCGMCGILYDSVVPIFGHQ
ncbi:unnamed protein product [Effrenium voratum]|nr:unnamed protein product [Effrenium voratum]